MAITAALAAAAVVGAGTGVYGAISAGQSAAAANKSNAAAIAENRRQNTQNSTVEMLNTLRNGRQAAIDNQRYDEAKVIEDAQRQLTNRIATATQQDADGNSLRFDPVTGTWSVNNTGVGAANADRRRTQTAYDATRALEGATVGGQQARDRMVQGGAQQGMERALSAELMNRYRQNQGRTPQQMEGALIEKNVAGVMDPIRRNGDMAMLAGYRQGNSGNDALLGALARQGSGATRSAIAEARFDAPGQSFNERDASVKSILGPATTLADRGANPGSAPPAAFGGDASNNLLAAIAKTNPAGIGTTLNPRGTQTPVNMRPGGMTGFTPLNATGNTAVGVSESLQSLLNNPLLKNYLQNRNSAPPNPAGIQYSPQSSYTPTDRNW